MTDEKLLAGKAVVVTGAGNGIGRAIAIELGKAGAQVVVNDIGASLTGEIGSEDPAEVVAREIQALGGTAIANKDSVSDAGSAQRIVEAALNAFGRVDCVVNNAGILRDRIFHNLSVDDWDAVLKVHLHGSFYVSKAAAVHFKAQGGGSFVHMTSASGLVGNMGQANYAAAKLGITALSKSIALDMQRFDVRSNCICPFAWSRMTSAIPTTTPEELTRVEKLKLMTPEKTAPLAVYLASNLSKSVTGQIFAVRNNEIMLMSQPRPLRSVHRSEGWSAETIAEHGIPALKNSFYALDRSADVFSWDPV
jgi:NAD(P)-dependent dehydrogenase (short-subunit alcohol dehydrogenase family)